MTIINTKDLNLVLAEAAALTNKGKWTKQDEKRFAFLQTAAAAIKAGASLSEVEQQNHNERMRASGLPVTNFTNTSFLSREVEVEMRGWQALVNKRAMGEGAPMLAQLGTYSSLGYFVPTNFYPELFAAMKASDCLLDEDSCTLIKSSNGRPLPVPVAGDTTVVASVISEAGSQTSVDIDSTGNVVLGAYSYSTPRFICSLEAFDDLEASFTAVGLFRQFAADRLARGISKDLVTGNGTGKTLGLIPSMEALGLPYITASGSSSNTGGSESGASSLGSGDFAAAFGEIDDAYLSSPKAAWIMNRSTLSTISNIITKYGQPLDLVKWFNGSPTIYGIPVKIAPSMDNIGASKTPVVLGDFSYWATRLIVDDASGICVYTQAPGLVENGNVGLRCFARAHGALLFTDTTSPAPFVAIQNHS
jgi:HK97 family phage major capsid protein